MISSSRNVKLEKAINAIAMIPLTHISRLIWDARLGARLKTLRGKTPRRVICERLKTAGFDLSVQGLAKYERGIIDSIDPKMIVCLLGILGFDIDALYPTVSHDSKLVRKLEPISA